MKALSIVGRGQLGWERCCLEREVTMTKDHALLCPLSGIPPCRLGDMSTSLPKSQIKCMTLILLPAKQVTPAKAGKERGIICSYL